jgi:hypothetical protein
VKLYCYHIPPIDFWFGALTDEQLLESAWGNYKDWGHMAAVCKEVAELKGQAEAAFKTINWEGDVREGPYFFALPGGTDLSIGYIIKQENNGNCFVASPEPLPFLDTLAFEKTAIG